LRPRKKPWIRDIKLKDTSHQIVRDFYSAVDTWNRSREKKGLKPIAMISANKKIKCLIQALNWAQEQEIIKEHPLAKVKLRKATSKEGRAFTDKQVESILSVCNENDRDFYTIGFHTGMRLAEICSMEWSWIDLTSPKCAFIKIPADKTKSRRSRIVPCRSVVRRILEKRLTTNSIGKVFTTIGTKRDVYQFATPQLKGYASEVGIEGIKAHDMRTTFITTCARNNKPQAFVMAVVGHKTARLTTEIYSKFSTITDAHLIEI